LLLIVSFVFGSTLNCSCEDLDDDDTDPFVEDDDDNGDDDVADDDSVIDPFSLAGEVFIVPVYYEQDENEIWNRVELD